MSNEPEPNGKASGTVGTSSGDRLRRVWRSIGQFLPWRDVLRLVLAAVVACVVLLLINTGLRQLPVWAWVLALLPAAMIIYHAVFLAVVKSQTVRRRILPQDQGPSDSGKTPGQGPANPVKTPAPGRANRDKTPGQGPGSGGDTAEGKRRAAYDYAASEFEEYFSPPRLLVQYGIPAMLNAVVALSLFYLVCLQPCCCKAGLSKAQWEGILFGGLGAYLCVLTQLGERTFRKDITSGAAVWATVQLVVGPLLGAIIGFLFTPSKPPGSIPETSGLTAAGLSFLAGFSPRFVLVTLLDKLRRLWTSPAAAPGARLVPLNQIRGITPAIEDRLGEEGIYDVTTLAGADILKLLRNAPFDKRQVLDWIDEAILIIYLPQYWQALENEGITGATDFAWCSMENVEEGDKKEMQKTEEYLKELAKRVKMDLKSLSCTADRLFESRHVQLVWALYDLGPEEKRAVGSE